MTPAATVPEETEQMSVPEAGMVAAERTTSAAFSVTDSGSFSALGIR